MAYRLSSSADMHIGFSEHSEVYGETVAIILQEKPSLPETQRWRSVLIWDWGCLQASSGGANLEGHDLEVFEKSLFNWGSSGSAVTETKEVYCEKIRSKY